MTDAHIATLTPADARAALRAHTEAAVRRALEAVAKACEDEADKCDDAAKFSAGRYRNDCKAAAYALRDRASIIRATDPAQFVQTPERKP